LKLRPDNLEGFYPYGQIAATLLHELSHNWVGEHNALFWSNYGQMRVEYMVTHRKLAEEGYVIDGRTSAVVAGLEYPSSHGRSGGGSMRGIYNAVVHELKGECASHGIPIEMVAPAIQHRCNEIEEKEVKAVDNGGGRKVGEESGGCTDDGGGTRSSRERALAAAERRRAQDGCQEKNEER